MSKELRAGERIAAHEAELSRLHARQAQLQAAPVVADCVPDAVILAHLADLRQTLLDGADVAKTRRALAIVVERVVAHGYRVEVVPRSEFWAK